MNTHILARMEPPDLEFNDHMTALREYEEPALKEPEIVDNRKEVNGFDYTLGTADSDNTSCTVKFDPIPPSQSMIYMTTETAILDKTRPIYISSETMRKIRENFTKDIEEQMLKSSLGIEFTTTGAVGDGTTDDATALQAAVTVSAGTKVNSKNDSNEPFVGLIASGDVT